MNKKHKQGIVQKFSNKELYEHYKELFHTSVWELHFANLQISQLLSIIDEIEILTNDNIIKQVIKNWKERYNLDKLIHARNLFNK